jgi:PAS domain S-box-containing protein
VAHHFEIIFEKNPDILVVMDRNYNIVRLNPSAKNFFSKGNVDVPTKGMNLMSLKNRYNIDLMILLNSLSEIKESFSQTQALQINEEFYTVYFASSDQFISFLMKDVTESKLNLRKLKDAQLNLRQLLDNSLDTVIYFNANLVVTYFNYEAAKNFQTMDGELLSEGVDIRSFLPEEFKFLMSEFDEIVQKGKRISKDVFIVNRWLRVNVYPIKDQELGNFQFALTASDVTNIKEMQRQLEIQNESLKKINWRHSHELRAPLSNILGLIQLLEGSSHIEKADFDALLDGLKRSSEQLDVVIHEIVNETYSSIG